MSDAASSGLLLPHRFRTIGLLLFACGAVLGFARFYFRWAPELLETKVFALGALYLRRKNFAVIPNNVTEEIAGVLVVGGLFSVAFAAEKTETAQVTSLRLRALILAAYGYAALLLLAILFTFGLVFIQSLLFVALSFPVLYLVAFGVLKRRIPRA